MGIVSLITIVTILGVSASIYFALIPSTSPRPGGSRSFAQRIVRFASSYDEERDKQREKEKQQEEDRINETERNGELAAEAFRVFLRSLATIKDALESDGFIVSIEYAHRVQRGYWKGSNAVRLSPPVGHIAGLIWPAIVWTSDRNQSAYVSVIVFHTRLGIFVHIHEGEKLYTKYSVEEAFECFVKIAIENASRANSARDRVIRELAPELWIARSFRLFVGAIVVYLLLV